MQSLRSSERDIMNFLNQHPICQFFFFKQLLLKSFKALRCLFQLVHLHSRPLTLSLCATTSFHQPILACLFIPCWGLPFSSTSALSVCLFVPLVYFRMVSVFLRLCRNKQWYKFISLRRRCFLVDTKLLNTVNVLIYHVKRKIDIKT